MVEQDLSQLQPRPDWRDPIVIVGAGPVGLSAALGLAHYGVPCLVLDDTEGTAVEGSRAIFMERHTLEVLGVWYHNAVPVHISRVRFPSPYQSTVMLCHTVLESCRTCSTEGSRLPTTCGRPIVCLVRAEAGWWITESKRNGAMSVTW